MQLTINNGLPGIQRGMPFGTIDDSGIAHRFNSRAETFTITVTYSAAQTHTVIISGIPYNGGSNKSVTVGPVTGDTDSNTTAQAILTAIKASALANAIVSVTRSTNVLTVVARRAGTLAVTGSATGGAATTVAKTVSEESLEAGVAVVSDYAANGTRAIRKPFAPTAQVDTITPNAVNSTLYTFTVRVFRSDGSVDGTWLVEVTSDGTATAQEIVDAQVARMAAIGVQGITPTNVANVLTLTGVAGYTFTILENTANLTPASVTAAVIPDLEGVTLWGKVQDSNQSLAGDSVWPARNIVHVMRRGRIGVYVDQTVTPQSVPHWRHTSSGANTVLGAWRADIDSNTALPVPRGAARFIEGASAGGVAVLEINLP